MKKCVLLTGMILCTTLTILKANAENVTVTNIYINNYPSQSHQYSGIICTERGGFCTNGVYVMGTRKTYYSPSPSRLKSSRNQRLGLNI